MQVMIEQFPNDLLHPILTELCKGSHITADMVKDIIYLLESQLVVPPTDKISFMCRPNGTSCTLYDGTMDFFEHLGDDLLVSGSVVGRGSGSDQASYIDDQRTLDLRNKLKSLCKAASTRHHSHFRNLDATACQYITSLKMQMVDTVCGFYIKALTILPHDTLHNHLLRGILVGGHCYGPLDPVSNIVLNSIWYNITFPLSHYDVGSTVIETADVLNTIPLLRMVLQSIDGLIALIRESTIMLSEHEAIEYLCYSQCHLSNFLANLAKINRKSPFAIAAKAAKHPQHVAFGSFLLSLDYSDVVFFSCSLSTWLSCDMLSSASLKQVEHFLFENKLHIAPALQQQAPPLCKQALMTVEENKLNFLQQQKFVRGKLQNLLIKHANEHPWEPRYYLDIICGVEKGCYSHSLCYHINFLASTCSYDSDDDNEPVPKLFFAEIWEQSSNSTKPSLCCPLPSYDACHSRCSLCEAAGNKIVHPPSGNYSGGNDGESLNHFGRNDSEAFDLLHSRAEIWKYAPDIVESDFIFFDRIRDVEVAGILNEMCANA